MPTTLIPGIFAVAIGMASESLAQTFSDNSSPLSSLGVFSAVVAAFLFMLKRSDGRDSARIRELTKLIVDLREDLKRERTDHAETRSKLIKVLESRPTDEGP